MVVNGSSSSWLPGVASRTSTLSTITPVNVSDFTRWSLMQISNCWLIVWPYIYRRRLVTVSYCKKSSWCLLLCKQMVTTPCKYEALAEALPTGLYILIILTMLLYNSYSQLARHQGVYLNSGLSTVRMWQLRPPNA